MKRRNILLGLCGFAALPQAFAQQQGWQARLISGGKQGEGFLYGLHITLQPGWKTYWINPGDAGIAPSIELDSKNISTIHTSFPVPLHFTDASGTSIGYHDEVVFLFEITTTDKLPPQDVSLKAFMGMCNEICVPAKINLPSADIVRDEQLIATWQDKLPRETDFVTQAKVIGNNLQITFNQKIDDAFLVGVKWTGQPSIVGNVAAFNLDEKELGSIKKYPYVIANVGGKGLQQMVTLQFPE